MIESTINDVKVGEWAGIKTIEETMLSGIVTEVISGMGYIMGIQLKIVGDCMINVPLHIIKEIYTPGQRNKVVALDELIEKYCINPELVYVDMDTKIIRDAIDVWDNLATDTELWDLMSKEDKIKLLDILEITFADAVDITDIRVNIKKCCKVWEHLAKSKIGN